MQRVGTEHRVGGRGRRCKYYKKKKDCAGVMQSDTLIARVIHPRRLILTWKLSAGRIKVVHVGIGEKRFFSGQV